MELSRDQRETKKELGLPLFVGVLVVKLKPILEILVNLIVWLALKQEILVQLVELLLLIDSLKVVLGFLDILRVHVLNSKVINENLLFINQLLQILFPQAFKVVRHSHRLELQLLYPIYRSFDLLHSLNHHFRHEYYRLNHERDNQDALNLRKIKAKNSQNSLT